MSTMREIIDILKGVATKEVPKEDGVEQLTETVTKALQEVGIQSLDGLSEIGALSVLFFLYGLGLADKGVLDSFVNSLYRSSADFFNIGFIPSPEENTFVMIEIRYAKRKDAMNVES